MLIPEQNIELCNAARTGQSDKARASFYRQLPLVDFILTGGLPKTVKSGLDIVGLPVGSPRAAVQPLDQAGQLRLAALLEPLH